MSSTHQKLLNKRLLALAKIRQSRPVIPKQGDAYRSGKQGDGHRSPRLLPGESFQVTVKRGRIQEEPASHPKLRKMGWGDMGRQRQPEFAGENVRKARVSQT